MHFARFLIHRFSKELIDWRWETLEYVTSELVDIYPFMKERFSLGAFGNSKGADSQVSKCVAAALQCKLFLPLTELFGLFSKVVGMEMRWMEGCYCHDHILTGTGTAATRLKLMEEAGLPRGHCPWKGKRAPSFALGHAAHMVARVKAASSAGYKRSLLKLDASLAARILAIENALKDSWCGEIAAKFDFWSRNGHTSMVNHAFTRLCDRCLQIHVASRVMGGPITNARICRKRARSRAVDAHCAWPQVSHPLQGLRCLLQLLWAFARGGEGVREGVLRGDGQHHRRAPEAPRGRGLAQQRERSVSAA